MMISSIMRLTQWIAFVSLINICYCSYSDRIEVREHSIHIRYEHQIKDGSNDFTHTIDTTLFNGIKATNCSTHNRQFCLKWGSRGQLRISRVNDHCENYQLWTTLDKELKVTFDLTGIHLYGGSQIEHQTWPIKNTDGKLNSFCTKEHNGEAIMQAVWITSNGSNLVVEEKVPLFVAYHKNSMDLVAKREPPYIRGSVTHMDYQICKYDTVKTAFQQVITDTVGKPVAAPDYRMVELPIWSTWARYKAAINDSVVLEYANSINQYGFQNSQLEIDDKWETCYGSLTPDPKKFPDMKGLVDKLHSLGFRVTLWVHPFVNANCQPFFDEGVKRKFFVQNSNGSVTTLWWNGLAAFIDFTNPYAVDWFRMRLQNLLDETGVDSYKFDSGEASFMPQPPIFHTMLEDHPDTMLKAYIATAASFGKMVEVRSGRRTQKYAIFTRMQDRESYWTGRLAFDTVIPEVLHMNVIGYPYVTPDMIGGNGYGTTVSKEMFVRWLEVSTFLPVLQFSYTPWDYDEEVVELARKYVELHKRYAPKIYELMNLATVNVTMVNAPLWWIDPTDPTALTVGTEYLMGDVLVAPVTEKGAVSRDIYFPKGTWRDEVIKGAPLIKGPTWVRNYPAGLEVLPYFTKVTESSSSILSPTVSVILCILLFLLSR